MVGEAVRVALNQIWSALQSIQHPCALMGGLALAVWNYPRATLDIDLLIAVDSSNVDPIIHQLGICGIRPKRFPPLLTIGTHHFLQFLYTPPGEYYDVQLDLLLAESDLQKSAIQRRVERDVPGVDSPVAILHCDDLILFKLLSGRLIDRADAAMLLRQNRDVLDIQYLHLWVKRLDLMQEFMEVWREACPDEAIPFPQT